MTTANCALRSLGIPQRTTIETLYERRFYLMKRRKFAQAAWALRHRNRRAARAVIETAQSMRQHWWNNFSLPKWLRYEPSTMEVD